MKDRQKAFLMLWIPIAIIICLAISGSIGKYHHDGRTGGYFTFMDMLPGYIILFLSSVFLYFIVGLEEPNRKEDHKH